MSRKGIAFEYYVFYCGLVLLALVFLYACYDFYDVDKRAAAPKLEESSESSKDGEGLINWEENKKMIAWIRMDNTEIHYPVMRAKDNRWYLTHDWQDEYSAGGSIFLDYRNKKDLSDNYLIIYGHRMNSNRMFSDIGKFADKEFFDQHQTGRIFRPGGEYFVQVYAFMQIEEDNPLYEINDRMTDDPYQTMKIIDKYAKYKNEKLGSEMELAYGAESTNGSERSKKIILLSTCNKEARKLRDVLVVVGDLV